MTFVIKMTATWIAGLTLLVGGVIGIVAPSTSLAQEYYDDIEWESDEGYHEEEWYDPSDWFDMDKGIEYEYDWGDGYGYYGDTYDDYDATDDWYYDYYDDSHVYDDAGYDDGVYAYTSNYYDYDGDGVYDAYSSYYDWDNDGVYEDYNYYSFANLEEADSKTKSADKKAQQQADQPQGEKSSKEYQVTGEVQKTKKVQVRQGKNLIAHVKADQGTFNVDLGPADKASGWSISEGTQLAARGPVTQVGDKQVMLAKKVKIGQNEASVDRDKAKVTGTIKSLKKASVRGTQHQLAVLNVKDKQKKVLVDMGPADKLSQNFSKGQEITAHGMPVRANKRPTVMASKVTHQGETIKIDRRQSQQSAGS
ncbi:hypothetical protein NG895_22225 [Aeoliella sp. ICT_H6.2]|uniref:Magnetosome protein MamS/MamX domain-containing protein n=1 Tax=Aeoliella straminimaris TaxID=2954799 RepID=A0A9X2FH78_9BACT|nr:hypothetical protein [Aeoliella straminimaris]MCO6046624.1 hypothetical protein [Aeoliella straminimaris]